MADYFKAYSVYVIIAVALGLNLWLGVFTADARTQAEFSKDQTQARLASTFRVDTNLTNSCIESGKTKTHCVCLTSIYKHQFSVTEYKAAVILFKAEHSDDPKASRAAKESLKVSGYKDEEITAINTKRRALSNPDEFRQLCHNASAFFAAD